jgi:hypothetical protein
VRLWRRREDGQRQHQSRGSGREEAAEGVEEWCVGEHAGGLTVKALIMPKASRGGKWLGLFFPCVRGGMALHDVG